MKKLLSAILIFSSLFLLSPHPAFAAVIALDGVTGLVSPSGGNVSVAVGNITNPALVVFNRDLGAGITAISCGGVSLTKKAERAAHDSVSVVNIWVGVGIPVNQTITCAYTGTTPDNSSETIITYSGVDQTTPVDQTGTASSVASGNVSLSLTPSNAGEWMLMGWDNNGGFAANGATTYTPRNAANPTGCSGATINVCRGGDSNGTITQSVSNTQTTSSSGGTQNWSAVGVTLNFAAATTAASTPITGIVRALWLF